MPHDDELTPERPESNRPGLLTIIITLLVLLAMLTSLVWPLLYAGPRHRAAPTPTPPFLQEAFGPESIGGLKPKLSQNQQSPPPGRTLKGARGLFI